MITVAFNDTVALEAFLHLATAMDDMTPAMQDVGEMLVMSTQDRMVAGVSPDGSAFAPRSQTTLDHYAALKPPLQPLGGPLNLGGDLIAGLYPEAGPDQVRIGSPAIQAAVMHFGAGARSLGPRSPWGDIPARPFLGLSDEDRSGIVEIVAEWLERAI